MYIYFLGKETINDNEKVLALKNRKVILEENEETKVTKVIKESVSLQSVALSYFIAKTFYLPKLSNNRFKLIQRCLFKVAQTKNFLELDYVSVKKILSSSELHITSELEIMKVADSWLRHNYNQRSKYANDILLRVRLPLLSMSVLKKVLGRSYNTRNSTVFQKNEECLETINKILENREEFYRDRTRLNFNTRYCSQEKIKYFGLRRF